MDTQGATVFKIGQVRTDSPSHFQHIQKATRCDVILSKVYHYVIEGWPNHVPDKLKPYKNRETEVSIENGCWMWGNGVIVLLQLQSQVSSCPSPRNHPHESNWLELLLVE